MCSSASLQAAPPHGAQVRQRLERQPHTPAASHNPSNAPISGAPEAGSEHDQSRLLCEDLFEKAPIPYAIGDLRGGVEAINQAGCSLLGRNRCQLLNAPFQDLVYSPDQRKFRDHFSNCKPGAPAETELRFRHPSGSLIRVRAITSITAQQYRSIFVALPQQGRAIKSLRKSSRASERELTEANKIQEDLLDRSEQEKRRISRDLNDGLCQEVAAASMYCSVLSKRSDTPKQVIKEMNVIAQLLGSIMRQARQIIRDLTPVQFDDFGLVVALEELCASARGSVACQFQCPTPILVSDNSVSLNLYQIAQNTMDALLKHCQPSRIQMDLFRKESKLVLQIAGDGKRIPSKPLRVLQHHAKCIQAALRVVSPRKGGIKLICSVELPS